MVAEVVDGLRVGVVVVGQIRVSTQASSRLAAQPEVWQSMVVVLREMGSSSGWKEP